MKDNTLITHSHHAKEKKEIKLKFYSDKDIFSKRMIKLRNNYNIIHILNIY